MTIDTYSVAVSLAALLAGGLTILALMGYCFLPRVRQKLAAVNYFTYLKIICVLAISATIGALFYQFYYQTPVCELCWWQRIFMFPISIVALLTISSEVRLNHRIIALLAAIGSAFAAYHYYYHFRIFVLNETLSLPCSGYGTLPACTSSPIEIFGFVTIPLMSLLVFLAILALCFFSAQTREAAVIEAQSNS